MKTRNARNPSSNAKRRKLAAPRRAAPETIPKHGRDYTSCILAFLSSAHGKTRVDPKGDHYYDNVSAVSLHFLLQSGLPGPEVLWQWYQHFDQRRSETIYQTIAPQRDEDLLAILEQCRFRWDPETVRESGLVFLEEHRQQVWVMLAEFLSLRLEQYRTLGDEALRAVLEPKGTWTEQHLARMVTQLQTQPLASGQRASIYEQLPTGYLKATARHLIDRAVQESFWKAPPPELEEFESGLIVFVRHMTAESRRLGVYVSKAEFEARWAREAWRERIHGSRGAAHAGGGNGSAFRDPFQVRHSVRDTYFATLGLSATASLQDVKSAYRQMVKQRHPDQGGTVQDFIQLQEAYEYLLTEVF